MAKEIKAVKEWLKKENNTKALLAARLGYTSSMSVHMWIKRNSIPGHMKKRVMEEIKK